MIRSEDLVIKEQAECEIRQLKRAAKKSIERKETLRDQPELPRSSYCLYRNISRRGCYREALLGHHEDKCGKEFEACFTVTATKDNRRHCSTFPVRLCNVAMDGDASEICGMCTGRIPLWTGHIEGCRMELFTCCRIQLVIRSLEDGSIAKVFLMSLDLEDMPADSKTIVSQTGTCYTLDGQCYRINTDVGHLFQFMISCDEKKNLLVCGRVRLALSLTKSASLMQKGRLSFPTGSEEYVEMRTEFPSNPKYFPNRPLTGCMTNTNEHTILR